MKIEWILCPFCGSKTRLKIRDDTILDNFPLYCPKCKHETLIAVRKLNLCARFRERRRILSGGGKCVFVNTPIFLPNRKTMRSC